MRAIAVLNVVVGLFLASGGATEFSVRGVGNGELVAGTVGLIGVAVSLFLAYTGILLWNGAAEGPRLAAIAATVSAVFHVLAAMVPPHFAGKMVMVLSVVYALVVIGATRFSPPAARIRQRA